MILKVGSQSLRLGHVFILGVVAACGLGMARVQAQQTLSSSRDQGRIMLGVLKNDVLKNYYDPNYHGIDVERRFKEAEEKIRQATSVAEILGIIGAVMMSFDDSHTYFVPPSFAVRIQHGWLMQTVGDQCYVVA